MESVDTFTLNLINTYLSDKVKNPEFEESLMDTLFRDQKFDLILHSLKEGFTLTEKVQAMILHSGELKLYQHLHEFKLLKFEPNTTNLAAASNKLETVKWVRKNGGMFDENTGGEAVKNGNIIILRWLVKNGCPTLNICIQAVKSGQVEILEYYRDNISRRLPQTYEICLLEEAVKHGQLMVLKWLLNNNYPLNTHKFYCDRAAEYGHLEILKFLIESNFEYDINTCAWAVQTGHLDIVQYLREKGLPWCSSYFTAATKGGKLEMVKWLRENGCPWDEYNCLHAAKYGQVEILQWLLENGCPAHIHTFNFAARNGYLEILQWYHKNGGICWRVLDSLTQEMKICNNAAKGGQLETLQWLIAIGCPYNLSKLKQKGSIPEVIAYIYSLKRIK